jgi:hypothetical protein
MKIPVLLLLALSLAAANPPAATETEAAAARIDGSGPGWVALGEKDFVAVNGAADTWTFDDPAATIRCTGQPLGVIRSAKAFTNFELVVEWQHHRPAGNSDRGLGGGEAGDGHAVRRAAHVVEAELVAELHRVRIAAVFAADAELDVGAGAAALGHGDLHELADAGLVEVAKGFFLKISFSV